MGKETLKFVWFWILIMLISGFIMSQPAKPEDFAKRVDRIFAARITPASPGAAVVVTEKGQPIFKQCYGLADVEHNIPITSKTMFNLASVAKQFMAFAILLLEKEGQISL